MDLITLIGWEVLWGAAGIVVFAMVVDTLNRAGMKRPNFTGRQIPIGAGIGFGLLAILLALGFTIVRPDAGLFGNLMLTLVLGFALLGFIDDAVPAREKGGFKAHVGRLVRERTLSTALIKAAFGLCLSVGVAFAWKQQWAAVTDGIIIALSANAVNLMDVRPGRALKLFFLVFIIIVGGSYLVEVVWRGATVTQATWMLLAPFFLWGLALSRYDFTCRAMMGDAGSNVLGAVLGLLVVWELSDTSRLIVLALLVVFHVMTELVSVTAIIEKSALLRGLDRMFVRVPEKAAPDDGT